MKLIKNINIVLPDKIIKGGSLAFDQKIEDIYKMDVSSDRQYERIIDGQGGYLTPGLIDIHIHGAGGHDTMEASYQALNTISQTIIKQGVTGFLPTTMTMAKEKIKKALDNIVSLQKDKIEGAEMLGTNVEGPFINPEYKGAQAEENILKPDLSLLEDYLDIIKIVSVAPEREGAKEFIRQMTAKGIVSSVGHSAATMDDINQARQEGLSHATHLFNAMSGLHHRHPGVVGAVLLSDMSCELIADYIHLQPSILQLVAKTKDPKNIILVTDAMEAAGLKEGEYELGGQKVLVKEGSARLEDGTLAGSVLTMDRALRNMYNATKLNLNEVINMATLNPARLIKLDHTLGKIAEGYRANLTLFDKKLEVKRVYISGEEKYRKSI
ncbi:MAG: N-acetylglucosamine-6-phosphate deacetylase [Bacillota bacterium]